MAPLHPDDTPSAESPTGGSSSPSSFSKYHSFSFQRDNDTGGTDNDPLTYRPGFTSSLLSRLSASRTKFDEWVSAQASRADAARKANEGAARRERDDIDGMTEELNRIRAQIGELEEEGGGGGAEESAPRRKEALLRDQAEVERSIANLHLGRRERQRELDDAAQEESAQRLLAERNRDRRRQVAELKEQTVEDLTVGQLKYRALGLTFTRSGETNSLRFSFVKIDREEPERKFEFTLCVNETEEWEVEECDPPLRAGSVIRLVDELNGEGDIGMFVRGMRKEFKAMV